VTDEERPLIRDLDEPLARLAPPGPPSQRRSDVGEDADRACSGD
jgi:hypothetical protein